MRKSRGFTLWELMGTLAIAGLLLGLGVPSFEAVVLDSRQTADIDGFVLAVHFARSEAAKRGHPVVLCKSSDGQTCGTDDVDFDVGWILFVNEDDRRPPQRSVAEPLLYVYRPRIEGTIVANRPFFDFYAYRHRSTNATVTFCDRRGAAAAKAVIVSYTGRPRVDRVQPDGSPLLCAGLP